MANEQDKIRRVMEDMAQGKEIGNKLVYDRNTKKIRSTPKYQDPDSKIEITSSDAELFG